MRAPWVHLLALALVPAAFGAQTAPRVYRDHVAPHWQAGNAKFWYQNELPGGAKETVVVDAERGTREVVDQPPQAELNREGVNAEAEIRPSPRTGPESALTFQNQRADAVELIWVDTEGRQHSYGKVEAGGRREMHTYAGHVWAVKTVEGGLLGVFEAADQPAVAVINGNLPPKGPRSPDSAKKEKEAGENVTGEVSPDGKWRVSLQDHNLVLTEASSGQTASLSQDGREDLSYQRWFWSPNSTTLISFRVAPGDKKEVHLIESSPKEGGRARWQSRPYALPGDRFPRYELNIFDITSRKQIKPETDLYEHEWEPPRVH